MGRYQVFGYMRISAKDQNEARQLAALEAYKIPQENLYLDKQSGKNFNRPAWSMLMERLEPGSLLYVKSIDRLGRNYEDIIEQWRIITKEKGADIRVLDLPLLDTTFGKDLLGTFVADLTLQIMSFTAQLERDMLRQRQAEGIAAAKARGIRWGKPPKELPDDYEMSLARYRNGEITMEVLEELFGMERSTIYRKLRNI